MIEQIKKAALLCLLVVTVSFSGCLGIGSNSSTTGTSPQRNDTKGVFKTTDGGRTWTTKNTVEGGNSFNLSQIQIASLAIDPDNTKVLYLGTAGGGMYKSENGGDSWKKLADANNKLRATASIYDIAIESGSSATLYASSLNDNRGVLLKSTDGGNSWTESYISTEKAQQINRVAIDPKEKNVVYIGTEQGGLIRSGDRGENWSPVRWFQTGVKDFVIDYRNNRGILVLTRDKLFKTTDGGGTAANSWQDITKSLTGNKTLNINSARFPDLSSMTMDAQDPLRVYMTFRNLIFVTQDGGMDWQVLQTITPSQEQSKSIPYIMKVGTVGSAIYYGAGNAIYKSLDKGATWSSFDIPVSTSVKYTVSDPKDYNVIYFGSSFK